MGTTLSKGDPLAQRVRVSSEHLVHRPSLTNLRFLSAADGPQLPFDSPSPGFLEHLTLLEHLDFL